MPEQNEYELRIQRLEDEARSNKEAHRDFYSRFENLNIQLVRYQSDMNHITEALSEISADVKELKDKPAKRYDTIIVSVLTAIVGGLVGYCFNVLF